jgi:hypothetical protein
MRGCEMRFLRADCEVKRVVKLTDTEAKKETNNELV